MPTQVRRQIARILKDKRHRNEYLMVLALMALTVTLGVASVLTQQGHAATKEVQVLDCHFDGFAAHTHDDSCYDEDGNLVCPLPEVEAHIHDDSCYADERVLVCGLEEGEEHTHDDSCYDVERTLICGRDEVAVSHVHGPGCFATVTVPAEDEAVAAPESAEQPTDRPASETHPAQKFDHEFKDADDNLVLRVDVDAPEGALPAGTTMVATWVDPETLSAKQQDAVDGAIAKKADGQVLGMQAVDISFRDASGAEVEPAKKVTVTMTSGLIDTDDQALVVHIEDLTDAQLHQQEQAIRDGASAEDAEPERRAEAVEALSERELERRGESLADDQLSFDSDRFSTYVLAVTSLHKVMQASDGATVTVTVDAPAEAGIPQGAELQVREVASGGADWQGYRDQALAALDADEAELARFFDIAIVGEDGEEVQPAQPVQVEIALADAPEGAEASVVHFGEGAEVVPATEDAGVATFDAAGFSVWGVVYTVDFHWTVDGQDFEYNLQGGGAIGLRELLPALGAVDTDQIEDFLAHVADVTFSNPELLAVEHVTEDTTAGALVESLGLLPEQSADLRNEELAEMLAKPLVAPDWALVSLQPFDSDETLTITMTNGEVLEIKVTDEQLSSLASITSEQEYLIYTKVGNTYCVLKNDGTTEAKREQDLDYLNNTYKWKFNYVYTDVYGQAYYNIYPSTNGHATLALNWYDQELVQGGTSNIVIEPASGGFTFKGYNHTYMTLDGTVLKGQHGPYVPLDVHYFEQYEHTPCVMGIYEQRPLDTYEFTVATDSQRMGYVEGKNKDGADDGGASEASYDTVTNTNKTNKYEIKAMRQNAQYMFDYWDLDGTPLDRTQYPATIPANSLTISQNQSTLTAHFKRDPNYEPPDDGKQGREVDVNELKEWLKSLEDQEMLDGYLKTAELYDYENRIYRVDLEAQSNFNTIDGKVDLGFIIDGSSSMNFPATLVKQTNLGEVNINHINDNSNNQNWLPDKNQIYYLISDKASTATVYRLQWDNGWYRQDASKTGLGEKITSATKFSGKPEENGLSYPIYIAQDGNTRQDYLENSISETLTELQSILNDALSVATPQDKNKEPEVKTAWVTYAKMILDKDFEFKSNKTSIMSPGYSQKGGTSTDIALLTAAGYKRADESWSKLAYNKSEFDKYPYPTFNGSNYTANGVYTKDSSKGFNWEANSKKYVILITDGAPQRDGYDVDYKMNPHGGKHDNILVPDAANYLKAGADGVLGTEDDVTLITVGLSMGDVRKGSVLLWDLATRDEEGDPYFYDVKDPAELKNALYEILKQVVGKAIVVGDVTDTINEAFYPVDILTGERLEQGHVINLKGERIAKNESRLTAAQKAEGYGTIKIVDGKYTVEWKDQNIPEDKWHGTVYVKAKEDFLGGNAVRTNDPDKPAKFEATGYRMDPQDVKINLADDKKETQTVETPRVNVNELNLTENSTEWTVYLGTEVDPVQQISALFEKIMVEQVVKENTARDSDGNGLKDEVTGSKSNYRFSVENSREDNRAADPSVETFQMKTLIQEIIKDLNKKNGTTLTLDQVIEEAIAQSAKPEKPKSVPGEPEPEEPEGGWNTGCVLEYGLYGQDCPGTVTIKLTRDHEYNVHNTDTVGSPVETYTLSVMFAPDYDAPPIGQGGKGEIEYHTGQFEMGYQGNAAGEDTSVNRHVINVYAEPLDVLKVDGEGEPLLGASFGLYRVAKNGETSESLATYDPSLNNAAGYYCVSSGTSNADGLVHLAVPSEGDSSKNLIVPGERYYLIETSAPSGYKRDSTTKVVTVETTNGLYTNLAGTPINAKTYPFNWDEGVIIKVDDSPATIVDAQGQQATNGSGQNLTYVLKSDPVTFQTTIVNEKVVVTDINVLKVDDDGEELADAVFQLKVVRDGSDVLVLNDSACSEVVGVGDVTVKVNGEDVTYASAFKSTDDKHQITGLPDGTYKLVEVQAPAGYVVTVPEIEFTIADGVVTSTTATSSADVKLAEATGNTLALLTITNTPGQPLPNAGGSGTTLFYVVGGLLMAGAAMAAVRDRRRACEA